jgi:hypothetical protein
MKFVRSRFLTIPKWAAVAGCLCVTALSCAAAPAPPPLPPKNVRAFPRATKKAPMPKVIRLAPGQTKITTAQLKSAPTVDEANRRATDRAEKPTHPKQIRIPGAPRILRSVPLPPSTHTTTPKPVAKPKSPAGKAKTVPAKGNHG